MVLQAVGPQPTGEGGAGEPLPSRAFLLPACAERGWEFRAAHLRPAVSKSAPSVGSPLPRLRLQKSGVGLVVYPGTPPHLGWPRNLKICSFLTYGRSRSLSVLSLSFRRRARAGDIRVLVLIRPVCPTAVPPTRCWNPSGCHSRLISGSVVPPWSGWSRAFFCHKCHVSNRNDRARRSNVASRGPHEDAEPLRVEGPRELKTYADFRDPDKGVIHNISLLPF